MHTARALLVIGALLIVLPYIGLPYSWLRVIVPAIGALILLIALRAIRMRRIRAQRETYEGTTGA